MQQKHLPLLGVGPLYVAVILAATLAGIYLSASGRMAYVTFTAAGPLCQALGVLCAALGVYLWVQAALFARVEDAIKKNQLLTDGVYAYVRNPVYSAFMLACSGALLLHANFVLLFLPFVYWLYMTLLLKHTEEKWLLARYGAPYAAYCQRVNRCLPWRPARTKG